MTNVWIVGQMEGGTPWGVRGVFSTSDGAEAMAREAVDNGGHDWFVWPLVLDEEVPTSGIGTLYANPA